MIANLTWKLTLTSLLCNGTIYDQKFDTDMHHKNTKSMYYNMMIFKPQLDDVKYVFTTAQKHM